MRKVNRAAERRLLKRRQPKEQHTLAPVITKKLASKGSRRHSRRNVRSQAIRNSALTIDSPQHRDMAWHDRNRGNWRALQHWWKSLEGIRRRDAREANQWDVLQEIFAFEMDAIRARIAVRAADVKEVDRHIG